MSNASQTPAIEDMPAHGGSWPTAAQELLLKAALLEGPAFKTAWQAWRTRVTLEKLDIGSHRLLPLLYQNLKAQGCQDEWLPRIKGVYRQSWYKNKLLFNRGGQLLAQLQGAGIKTMLLKGAVLSKLYYEDDGARAMTDFDVLIPAHQVRAAQEVLQQHEWQSKKLYPLFGRNYRVTSLAHALPLMHACSFADRDGYETDLHWSLFFERRHPRADDEFWARAQPFEFEGGQTLTLDPTDLLFHCCVHGAEWNPLPPCRWVADALLILRRAPQIEWPRLLHHARRLQMVPAMRDTLTYLRTGFEVAVPEDLLQEIRALALSRTEVLAYQMKLAAEPRNVCSVWWRLWIDYCRSAPSPVGRIPVWSFAQYCMRRGAAVAGLWLCAVRQSGDEQRASELALDCADKAGS